MFWFVLAAVAIIYVGNAALAMRQMRNFSDAYTLLRRNGRVVIGKQKNALSRGAIIMFLLDDQDRVVMGRRMSGMTVLARFKDFTIFNGLSVPDIDPAVVRIDRGTRRAVANARDNYLTVESGGIPVEPATPLMKVVNRVDARVRRPAVPTSRTTVPARVVHRRGVRGTD